jgi:hypothetical protein
MNAQDGDRGQSMAVSAGRKSNGAQSRKRQFGQKIWVERGPQVRRATLISVFSVFTEILIQKNLTRKKLTHFLANFQEFG